MLFIIYFRVILKFCDSLKVVLALAVVSKIVLGGCVNSDRINVEVCAMPRKICTGLSLGVAGSEPDWCTVAGYLDARQCDMNFQVSTV